MNASRLWMSLALLSLLVGSVFAQGTGTLAGQVRDANGGALAGATITIANPARSVSQTATTNEDGVFVSAQIPPGVYTVRVEKAGFKKVEKTNVVLSTADKLNVGEIMLEHRQHTPAGYVLR